MKFILVIVLLINVVVYAQEDKLFIFDSNNDHSLRNEYSVELTDGSFLFLITEFYNNENPNSTPIEGGAVYRNILVKIDSSGNEFWRSPIDSFSFGNSFIPSKKFYMLGSFLQLPFHYYDNYNGCISGFNGVNFGGTVISDTYKPAVALIQTNTGSVVLTKKFDENALCGNNNLMYYTKTTQGFNTFISNEKYNVTFKEVRDGNYNIIYTDTLYHRFNDNVFSSTFPFENKWFPYKTDSLLTFNGYIYDTSNALVDSLFVNKFQIKDHNNDYYVSFKNNFDFNFSNKIEIKNINGDDYSNMVVYDGSIKDIKINSNNDILILLNNGKILKTNVDFETILEKNFLEESHYANIIDFTENEEYIVSGAIVTETETHHYPDKAFLYKGFLKNINNEFTSINSLIESNFFVYPNPTKGSLNFEITDNKVRNIIIYDTHGNVVLKETNISFKNSLDLSQFQNGVYFLKASSIINGVFYKKIILNK